VRNAIFRIQKCTGQVGLSSRPLNSSNLIKFGIQFLFIFSILINFGCGKVASSIEDQSGVKAIEISPPFASLTYLEQKTFLISGGAVPYTVEKISGLGLLNFSGSSLTYTASSSPEIAQFKVTDSTGSYAILSLQVLDPSAIYITANLAGSPTAYYNESELNVVVSGTGIIKYRYALILQSQSCSEASGYSAERLVSQTISDSHSADGSYRLCVLGINSLGQFQPATAATQVDFVWDLTPPSTGSASINSGSNNSVNSTSLTLNFAYSGASQIYITNTLSCLGSGSWQSYTPSKSWTIDAGDGSKNIYYKLRDAALNETSCFSISAILDTQAPNAPTGLSNHNVSILQTESPTVSWSLSTDNGLSGISHYEMAIGTSSGATDIKNWTSAGSASSGKVTGLSLNGSTTYHVSIRAVDNAGNFSSAVAGTPFTYSTDPCDGYPTVGTVCTNGSIYLGTYDWDGPGPGAAERYAIMPRGCVDSTSNPTCTGGAETTQKKWGEADIVDTAVPNSTTFAPDYSDGRVNTQILATTDSDSVASGFQTHPAALYCHDMVYGGKTDWYLANHSEFANVVFCRSDRTAGFLPGMPQEFPDCGGSGLSSAFTLYNSVYWTSSEFNEYSGWLQNTGNGSQGNTYMTSPTKTSSLHVRCIRRY
jgi:hypothetical protein